MKIAQLSKPWALVPPDKYGGLERVVAYLSSELSCKHSVTLFAPRGSNINSKVKVKSVFNEGMGDKGMDRNLELIQSVHAVECHLKNDHFDVMHAHSVDSILGLYRVKKLPLLFTFHSPPSYTTRLLIKNTSGVRYVFVSKSLREQFPTIKGADVIHNGLPIEKFDYTDIKDDYFVFVGAIRKEKGLEDAIKVATRTKTKLIIVGRVRPEHRDYFEIEIKPILKNRYVKFLGELGEKDKNNIVLKAKALLMPIKWEEPFSTSLMESLALGTPVIAYDKGGVREVIDSGVNSFVVRNVDEMVEAAKKVSTISPEICRRTIATNFNSRIMSDAYLSLYKKYF